MTSRLISKLFVDVADAWTITRGISNCRHALLIGLIIIDTHISHVF
jgi:hypothetical protein